MLTQTGRAWFGPGLLFIFLLTTACGSLRPRYTTQQWLGGFPQESSGYLAINNPAAAEPLLEVLEGKLEGNQGLLEEVLGRTDRVYASFTPGPEGSFALILVGAYPYLFYNAGVAFARQWEQVGSPVDYFQHTESTLKLANPNGYLILVTDGDIRELKERFKNPSPLQLELQLEQEFAVSDFFLLFPRFAGEMVPPGIPFNKKKLPIKEAWVTSRLEESYRLAGGFNLQEARYTSRFVRSFKLFLLWWMRQVKVEGLSARLKKIEFETEEGIVRFGGMEFYSEELVRALRVFVK